MERGAGSLLPRIAAWTGARKARRGARIQSLWRGYGELFRVHLDGAQMETVVVKVVRPPRGSGDRGHARKMRSYAVEQTFYTDFGGRCGAAARVPALLGAAAEPGGWVFVLEDLDAAGFPARRLGSTLAVHAVIDWLSAFHGRFLGTAPDGLWPVGTYWHLATRPDELATMSAGPLKAAAGAIAGRLNGARFQTLVHGDAKLANFCFAPHGRGVAAVDFQYVGGGVGVRDLAYYLGSVWRDRDLDRRAEAALDRYFAGLVASAPDHVDTRALEKEWRALWPFAWADFERFLAGWAPSATPSGAYATRQVDRVLVELGGVPAS